MRTSALVSPCQRFSSHDQLCNTAVSLPFSVCAHLLQPVIAPAVPQRIYFIFRKPIPTEPSLAEDRHSCQGLYQHIKSEVEDGMGYLLRKREQDPYKDFLPRMAYEMSWGQQRQAPSFEP
jgi:hypothetical protein